MCIRDRAIATLTVYARYDIWYGGDKTLIKLITRRGFLITYTVASIVRKVSLLIPFNLWHPFKSNTWMVYTMVGITSQSASQSPFYRTESANPIKLPR